MSSRKKQRVDGEDHSGLLTVELVPQLHRHGDEMRNLCEATDEELRKQKNRPDASRPWKDLVSKWSEQVAWSLPRTLGPSLQSEQPSSGHFRY